MKYYKTYLAIGLNILYYRKQAGVTQQMLAELIDVSKNHVQRVETGVSVPSVKLLLQIAEALNISPAKLFEFK